MAVFATLEDLTRSLAAVPALAEHRDAIVATARPTILFLRKQEDDDPLPVGASKIGGLPDLPPDFAWPERPPYPNAAEREQSLMDLAQRLANMGTDVRDEYRGKSAFFAHPFPLAFHSQIDLGALAALPGFPPGLPRQGLLSIFLDTLDGYEGGPRLIWHDGPLASLRRREIPASLAAFYETYSDSMGDTAEERAWSDLKKAEVLHPVSAVMVPEHWRSALDGDAADALDEWMDEADGQLDVNEAVADATNFGDHLGGWPVNIQGHAEEEIDDVEIDVPGRTPWRHIYSFGGENWSGTRLVPLDHTSDGNTYIFLDEADLLARRFDRARAVHQMT